MVTKSAHRLRAILLLANAIVLTIVINQLSALYFFRLDLTQEGRYTIKPQTEKLLESLDDAVLIEVFLAGDLNAGFSRFQKSIREMLEEFSVRSNGKVTFLFTDPLQAQSEKSRNDFMASLVDKGLKPLNIIEDKDGKRSEKIVFPGAMVSYANMETPVNLLKNSSTQQGAQNALNQSIETLEFELASAISRLTNSGLKKIAWIKGHGEADSLAVASIQNALLEQFDLFKVELPQVNTLTGYDLALIARPTRPWSTEDLYKLDQFILQGGKAMFFVDNIRVDMKKISEGEDYGAPVDHGLQELLFRYGVRINPDLIQDLAALPLPVVTGEAGGRSQITPIPWPFFPIVTDYADHPASRNLDASVFRFVSSIDTVKAEGIRKTVLAKTSPYTRLVQMPAPIRIADLREQLNPQDFRSGQLPVVLMLEGNFQSLFKNRIPPEHVDATGRRDEGVFSRIVVVGDGDYILNGLDPRTGEPTPAGYDPATRQTFANQDLIMNTVAFLIDDQGIINARNRKVTVRLLDKEKIRTDRSLLQWMNLGLPVVVMALFGMALAWRRKNRYAKF